MPTTSIDRRSFSFLDTEGLLEFRVA